MISKSRNKVYDYQTTMGQRPEREYCQSTGRKEMVGVNPPPRSVGVKELKFPCRKQKLPEGMGKKIKLCVDCIP